MNSPNTHTLFQTFARLVVCAALVVASIPVVACADDTAPSIQSDSSSSQVVRVGYLNSAGYEEGGEGQYKSGWGYEYLQTLSYHTGWTYEYVYGNFSELMEKLQAVDAFVGKPAGTFDAVLMDIMMPVMNGYEASRAIRLSGKRDADTIVIVAMTANAFVEDVQASKEAGMNEHLAKPIDMDKLKAALARLVK